MSKEYLDLTGLSYFWGQIKNALNNKADISAIPTVPTAYTSNPVMDGEATPGSATTWARGDHRHPIDTSRAPTSHATSATTYGKGTGTNYGHVKLSDSTTDSTTASASGGTAATPKAVYSALAAAKTYADGKTDNNFTTAYKDKLDAIASGAEVNVQADWNVTDSTQDSFIKNKPTIPAAVTVDSALSSTSTNPVQNKAIYSSLSEKIASTAIGSANGVCPLNADSIVDAAYLPSYVDDVIEAYPRSGQTELSQNWLATGSASGTVIVPESGKIYILMADSTSYAAYTQFRWSGSSYVKMMDGGVSSITNAEIDTIVAS